MSVFSDIVFKFDPGPSHHVTGAVTAHTQVYFCVGLNIRWMQKVIDSTAAGL